jgi:O-antigen biosynthesis protein
MKNGRWKGRARVLEKAGDISMNLGADQILNLDGDRARLNVAADRSKTVESSTRTAVLVLGMHRSGTSSVAGSLIRLGGAAPFNLLPPQEDNPSGFWESSVLVALNDEILAAGGSHWRDWRAFDPTRIDAATAVALRARAKAALSGEFGEASLAIIKDPRMCRLLPFWSAVFHEAEWSVRPVLLLRSPLEVALSLNRRDGIALSRGCLIWLRHVLDAEAETRRMRRAVLNWNDFLADRRGALEQLGEQLDLAWPRWSDSALAEIDEFVSADLKHQSASEEDLRVHPAVSDLVRASNAAMIELAKDPSNGRTWRKLDDARNRFGDAAAIFGQAMFEPEEEIRRLQSLAKHQQEEQARQLDVLHDRLGAQFAAARHEFASQLAAERDNFARQVAAERDSFASQLEAARNEFAREVDGNRGEFAMLLAERDARLTEKNVLIADKNLLIAEQEREIGRTEAVLADRERELASAKVELAQKEIFASKQFEQEEAQAAAESEAAARFSRLTGDRDFLARYLSRTYHRPWRPLKHHLNYHLLRSFSALTAPFSERMASRFARSSQKRNPSRFDTYLPGTAAAPPIALAARGISSSPHPAVAEASGSLASVEPADLEPAEPEITPLPIKLVVRGGSGKVTVGAAAALAMIPWQPRVRELSSAAADQVKRRYTAAKLAMIQSHGGELLAEFQAAISNCAACATISATTEGLVRAAGIVSPREAPAGQEEHLPTPILRRYRAAQIATTRRFGLDHRDVGARSGPVTISILVPVFKTPLIYLERALLSVICQTYREWELCVVDDGSGDANIAAVLDYYESLDRRIRVKQKPQNAGISSTTNIALEMATGQYIGLLDADDMLTYDALENVADRLAEDPKIDLVYTDECKIDENDIVQQLMPKPDWSPLLLTAFMYTGHFSVYRASIVRQLGGLRSRYDLSQDYDLALRVADLNPRVAHIRGYHYGWRMIAGSASVGGKPRARETNIAALQDALDRRGWGGKAIALPTANRALRTASDGGPLVSIVIPTGGKIPLLSRCVSTIFERTSHQKLEVVIVPSYVDAQSELLAYLGALSADPRISVVDYRGPYNFSRKCNVGAAAASGEVVIFYNDDVFVITPDWIQAILECLTLPGVGAVAPKLLYLDNGIQHAGMVTGTRRLLGTAFHTYPRGTTANMNLAQSVREVSLLSAACLAMGKNVFDEVGGFDEVNAPREHSDVDLCFRVRELGYSCVYTPHAELTHIGHVTMRADESENKTYTKAKHDIYLMKRFGSYIADDPYFTEPLRDLLYTDSQEAFRFFPRKASLPDGPSATGNVHRALDIMIFSHDLTESGAPRAAFDVARTLRNAGHFVVVASPSDGPYRERLRNSGVDVIVDEVLLKQDHNVFDLARNFDKVICNTIVCWPAVAQLHEAVDTYWYVHESELIREFAENVPGFAALLHKGIPIWADSRLASRFLSMYGTAHSVIEYGIEDHRNRFPAAPKRGSEKVVIGVFGSYENRKGQDLAVSGMLRVSRELQMQSELRFFGRTLAPRFRAEIERSASGSRSIVFFGEVDHDECLSQMAACDIILIPSRDDAMSFVGLDALSLGKALVCSRTTGVSEYLQDGQSVLIVDENTPEEIGQVLARAIANPELRAALAQGARAVYERTFTEQRFAQNLEAALGIGPPAPTTVGGDEPVLKSMQSSPERSSTI